MICDFYKFTKCCTCHVQYKFRGPETDFMGTVKPEAEKKPCYFASVCCLKICMFFFVVVKISIHQKYMLRNWRRRKNQMNLSSSGRNHVGLLFTNEELKKTGW